jgi:hypothetical protein
MFSDLLLLALIIFIAIPAMLFALYAALSAALFVTVGPLLILSESTRKS